MDYRTPESVKRIGTGLSIIAFPILLLFGFISHPNLFSINVIANATQWVDEWRGNFLFHFGHFLVLISVPPIIVTSVHFSSILRGPGSWYGFIGGVLAVFGAFILAVDKGALTLGLTAFQTIPDEQFGNILPALQALLDKAGWLWMLWLFLLLPLGFIIQIIGLINESFISKRQGSTIIIGLVLLINPDIEIISSVGAALMCAGLIPIGVRELKGTFEPNSKLPT